MCVICGQPLGKGKQKYCSNPCAVKALVASEAYKRAQKNRTNKHIKKPRQCVVCGTRWLTENRNALYCNPMCYCYDKTGHWPVRRWPRYRPRQPPKRKLRLPVLADRVTIRTTIGTRLWVAGYCTRCANPYVIVDQTQARYCSRSCARSDSKARRRAAKAGALVAPVWRTRTFERDKWTCQLCGKRVHRSRKVPHPMAPTLDHIIPLALGGTHEPANCQTAHFKCNSSKSWRGTGDQLLLLG